MKRNVWIFTLILTAAVFAAGAAFAETPSNWKAGDVVDCESWDGGERVRCGMRGFGSAIATVKAKRPVTVTYDEYHSLCGSASHIVHSESMTVAPENPRTFRVLAAGYGVTCRELFFVTCREPDGKHVPCGDVLTVTYRTFIGNLQ